MKHIPGIVILLLAASAFGQSHLSPHFPPGATDLVPMHNQLPPVGPSVQAPEMQQATISNKGGYYYPAQPEPQGVLDFPTPEPIRFIVIKETLMLDQTVRRFWIVNPEY